MATKKEKFVIIDGNALIHRSFHALPPLTTTKGEQVNAVYGFASVLLKVIKDLKPDYIAATFDLAAPTFRHKEYEQYKATRVKAAQELYDQIPRVKDLVRAFNIPIYEKEGFEADDLIGTVSAKLANRPIETTIVTGDMDTLQLVDNQTKVCTLKHGVGEIAIYGPREVRERYGLGPEQMIDYKALRGDPSDNIPGVPGIGEKTAIELLQLMGSVDALYDAMKNKSAKLKKIRPRVLELLEGHRREAELSKKLATIVRNVPIDFALNDARTHDYDRQQVVDLFQKLEFRSLLMKLPTVKALHQAPARLPLTSHPKTKARYALVETEAAFSLFLAALRQQKRFAFDTETTSLDPVQAQLLGISFCWKEGEASFLSVRHPRGAQWLQKLRSILEDPHVQKYGHNLKYDYQVLRQTGIVVLPLSFDSMIASYLLNPGSRQHGLDALAFGEFGYEMMPITALIGKGKDQRPLADAPVDQLSWYSCEDADFTWRLCQKLRGELMQHNLERVFSLIEMPLVPVLADMELDGIKVDTAFLETMARHVRHNLKQIEADIHHDGGGAFNIQSPAQLKDVLFEKLKISTEGIGKTKTGLSTAAAELEKLQDAHPIVKKILAYREMSKLLSTYLEALPELVSPTTGRVHTDYNQTIAATGRLSSSNPNLQNIPTRTELGHAIRKAFIADRGNRLLSADYSQIELRIVADLASDEKMLATFRRGEDIHARTAAEINDVPLDQVTKSMRNAAKEVNFGVLYGMGVYGLASRTGISRDQAKAFIDKYFAVYRHVAIYLEKMKEHARRLGYVETIFGRRRYLPDINSRVAQLRNAAERMAVNMPIQGTAADLMKLAMIRIHQQLPSISPKSRMLLQVHDELVFEVPAREVQTVAKFVRGVMEGVEKISVPILVTLSEGMNWGELKELQKEHAAG
ncbi:MAG: DNA polymerase I [bacterium]